MRRTDSNCFANRAPAQPPKLIRIRCPKADHLLGAIAMRKRQPVALATKWQSESAA
jgi:hypothetical protein